MSEKTTMSRDFAYVQSFTFQMESNVGDLWSHLSDGKLRLPRGWWLYSTVNTDGPGYAVEFRMAPDSDTSVPAVMYVMSKLHHISEGE